MNDFTRDLFGNGSLRAAVICVLAVLSLFLIVQTVGVAQSYGRSAYPATDVITVNGNGQATLPPDVARVSFTVEHTASTVADAQAATTKQANAVIDYVKGQGIADKDVRTLSYNITPQYAYPNPCPPGALCPTYNSPKVTGYQVSESVQVTLRDLSKVGDLLGGLGKLEVQNVSGPSFALDDSTAGYAAARADAIAKAKAQATELAKELGVSLGKIVNFSESSGGYPSPISYGMAADTMVKTAAAPPTVPVGENTYNASISITYEIR